MRYGSYFCSWIFVIAAILHAPGCARKVHSVGTGQALDIYSYDRPEIERFVEAQIPGAEYAGAVRRNSSGTALEIFFEDESNKSTSSTSVYGAPPYILSVDLEGRTTHYRETAKLLEVLSDGYAIWAARGPAEAQPVYYQIGFGPTILSDGSGDFFAIRKEGVGFDIRKFSAPNETYLSIRFDSPSRFFVRETSIVGFGRSVLPDGSSLLFGKEYLVGSDGPELVSRFEIPSPKRTGHGVQFNVVDVDPESSAVLTLLSHDTPLEFLNRLYIFTPATSQLTQLPGRAKYRSFFLQSDVIKQCASREEIQGQPTN